MTKRFFSTLSLQQKSSSFKTVALWSILALCAICTFFWLWTKSDNHEVLNDPALMPLFISDGKPFKIRAKDPGGFQILHQDKEIYNRLVKNASTPEVHSDDIASPSEEPILLNEETPSLAEMPKRDDNITLESLHIAPNSPPSPMDEAQNKSWTDIFENLIQNGIEENNQSNSRPLTYRVQLAILKNKDQAHAEWHRLSIKFKHLLQNLNMSILSEVKPDGSLRFYIQVGDFSSSKEAESLCATLKQHNVSCLVMTQKGDS